jgi:hypothetical protein
MPQLVFKHPDFVISPVGYMVEQTGYKFSFLSHARVLGDNKRDPQTTLMVMNLQKPWLSFQRFILFLILNPRPSI